ncbi:MAG: FAD-dependent oxidoreductase [Gemmatimonadaceae bacterium]|nr:FAD-dependent oxidoreductase [Gemmatimonadaceae bacterium]
MTRIVILGAGAAGTMTANRLSRRYATERRAGTLQITVVDQDAAHLYQPGLLFLPFGRGTPESLVRDRRSQLPEGITYIQQGIEQVDTDTDTVRLHDGSTLSYDVLVVATGTRTLPGETEGLTDTGWNESAFDFYTLAGATALRDRLATFTKGRIVVTFVEAPIKCPVAPLEFAFLADSHFRALGLRDSVDVTYVTPLDAAFTKPIAAERLGHLLKEREITVVTEFATGNVDGEAKVLRSWDGREVPYDVLVIVPVHGGAEFVSKSPGLGDALGFVITDPHTLQAKVKANVFAIGDCTNLPTSKAGSVAHFEAEVLVPNIARFLEGRPLDPAYDGHANCFVETGHDRAILIDFNYETEPLPGHYPFAVGPLSLLEESRVNHLGKLGFKWAYWNVILPGYDIPGITPQMQMTGKTLVPARSAQ